MHTVSFRAHLIHTFSLFGNESVNNDFWQTARRVKLPQHFMPHSFASLSTYDQYHYAIRQMNKKRKYPSEIEENNRRKIVRAHNMVVVCHSHHENSNRGREQHVQGPDKFPFKSVHETTCLIKLHARPAKLITSTILSLGNDNEDRYIWAQ